MALEKLNINGINELDFPTGVDSVSVTDDIATVNLSPATGLFILNMIVDTGAPAPVVANDLVEFGEDWNQDGVVQADGLYPMIGVSLDSGNPGDPVRIQISGKALVNTNPSSPNLQAQAVTAFAALPGKAAGTGLSDTSQLQQIAGLGLSNTTAGQAILQIAPYELNAKPFGDIRRKYLINAGTPTVTAGQAVAIAPLTSNELILCTSTTVPLGIAQESGVAGDQIYVLLVGLDETGNVIADTSFVYGDLLAVNNSSNVVVASPASGTSVRTIGMAVDAGAAGPIIVFVYPGIDTAVSTVTSVFGRTGAVVAATNDYNFNQLAGKAGLAQGGTNVDLSASGSATAVLAQDAAHVISARSLVAADIPNLDASKITTGQLALARGGTAVDLSASGGATKILAQDAAHLISARDLVAADIPSLSATYQLKSEKDAANGYAGLDSSIFLKSAEFNLTRNVQSGAYAILDADRAKVVSCTSATSVAWTIAQAGASSAFLAGWYCIVKNTGLGTITLTPATSTIESAAKVIIPPGSSFLLLSDGTNYLMPLENISKVTGRSFFTTDGTDRNLVGSGVLAIVSTANAVIGLQCQLSGPRLVNKVQFGFQANASGSSQTADMGIYDSLGNLIFNIGATTKANGAGATYPSAVPTGGILFMPGNYISSWTCSATTPTFYASVTLVGGATSGFMGNLTVAPFFLAGNAASAGALPATLGTLGSSALGSGDVNGNIPIILFLA